jgi:hypothetical protein
MLSKTELEQKVVLDYQGNKILGKIIKVYGQENPYQRGHFAKINVATPHGSIVHGGLAWFRDPTEEELAQLKEYEDDAAANNRLYEFDNEKNVEY